MTTDSAREERAPGAPAAARPSRVPDTFRALRHRNFQLYFGGQLVSVAGTWMQIIAQGWLVYRLSHSEQALGVVGFAGAIPALLASPWGGVLVDRVSKRNLLVVAQALMMLLAFIQAALAFTQLIQVWHIVALAVALGFVNALEAPARQAFTVEMVGREDLTNAIALSSIMFNGARVVGPALGGLLLATVGDGWCFFINGLSFLAVIGGLLAMQVAPVSPPLRIVSPWRELAQGLHYVLLHPEQFGLLLLSLIYSVFGLSYATVLPAFVDRVLHADAAAFGVINAVTGLGAMCGALAVAHSGGPGQRGRWLLLGCGVFSLALALFAYIPLYWLSLALAFVLGLSFMVQFTLMNTLLQLHVADAMRGRVMALYTLTFFGFLPFGNLALGTLAEAWGLSLSLALSAGVALLLAAAVFVIVPRLRRMP
ncbi:MAG: MFS transporter [Anaerolineales bacterium]|nr:MFS transporter [Anaerolineales bacterium]